MANADDDWGEDEEATTPVLELGVEILPDANVVDGENDRKVMVRIQVPEGEQPMEVLPRTKSGKVERAPMDVCCVIDISGSMSSKATYEVDGVKKDDGLTYLDIVKHAVKAVINIMKAQDRFTLVSFQSRADIIFELDHMTPEGKEKATAALESKHPGGGTNMWGGIHAGLEAMRASGKDAGFRQKAVLLLTDGCPSDNPEKGHMGELRSYKESHPDFNFQLNTFGFGYNLKSDLLLDLAVEGGGTFGFIPDALIVGTAFVNSVCNSLSTQTQNATLHLMAQGGAQFTDPIIGVGEGMVTDASWGRVVSLGPLQFGQSREVVVPMKIPSGDQPYLEAVVVYPSGDGKEVRSKGVGDNRTASVDARVALCRGLTVEAGYKVVKLYQEGKCKEGDQVLDELKAKMDSTFPEPDTGPENYTTLKLDVDGRMTKARDGLDRFNRWGKHYLRALTRAHQLQLCTNFMDPGLQVYGGCLFKGLRDEGDTVFLALPPPVPSARPAPTASSGYSGGGGAPAASPDMSTYYAGGGGG